ncbi:MAG: ornithine carbamoyltransferase [Chloroflexota bacterium]|nr:ornithine carbamoyltransferase [Chloroflexota bacterium]
MHAPASRYTASAFPGGLPVYGRDLLSIADLSPDELDRILQTALSLKRDGGGARLLAGKTLALIFEKPSLRTRVSFDVAMQELGGHAVYLSQAEVGLGQREPVADVARVLSRYVDVIAARTYLHQTLLDLARHAGVPVVNALSDEEHPCQALADLLTVLERFGTLRGVRLAYIGDGFNVAASLAEAAALAGMSFAIASPEGYRLPDATLGFIERTAADSGGRIDVCATPAAAVRGADVVYTDVWTSMGQEDSYAERKEAFAGYTVTAELLALAKPSAIFMHDLPAHRGDEVTEEVIEGAQSVVFDQAENRLHAQKAILALVASDQAL